MAGAYRVSSKTSLFTLQVVLWQGRFLWTPCSKGWIHTHQSLHQTSPQTSHLLQVAIHVKHSVLLTQLYVGVDGDVDTWSTSSITEILFIDYSNTIHWSLKYYWLITQIFFIDNWNIIQWSCNLWCCSVVWLVAIWWWLLGRIIKCHYCRWLLDNIE